MIKRKRTEDTTTLFTKPDIPRNEGHTTSSMNTAETAVLTMLMMSHDVHDEDV